MRADRQDIRFLRSQALPERLLLKRFQKVPCSRPLGSLGLGKQRPCEAAAPHLRLTLLKAWETPLRMVYQRLSLLRLIRLGPIRNCARTQDSSIRTVQSA
jgi:hypothetical protein